MNDDDKKAVGILGGALLGAAGVGAYAYYKAKNAVPNDIQDIFEGLGEVKEKAKEAGEKTREYIEKLVKVANGTIEQPEATAQVVSTVFETVRDAGLNPSSLFIPSSAVPGGPLASLVTDQALKIGFNVGRNAGEYLIKTINDAGETVIVLSEVALGESTLTTFKRLSGGVYGLATAVAYIDYEEPTSGTPSNPTQPDPQVPISEQPTGGTLLEQLQYDFPIEKITRTSVKHNGEWITIDILNVTSRNFLAGANKNNVTQWMRQASGIDWKITAYSYYNSDMRVVAAYLDKDGKIRYTLLTDYGFITNPANHDYADAVRQVPAENFVLFRPKRFRLKVNHENTYITSAQPTFYRSLTSLITTGGYTVPTLLDLTMRENGDVPFIEHMTFTGSLTSE